LPYRTEETPVGGVAQNGDGFSPPENLRFGVNTNWPRHRGLGPQEWILRCVFIR
jgi:hypothetical protein